MWQLVVPLLLQLNHTLESIYQEQRYETLLLFKHSSSNSRAWQEGLDLAAVSLPVLSLDERMDFYLSDSCNNEMLALVWQSENYDMNLELWQALDRNLENMRQVRLMFVLESEVQERVRLLEHIAARAEEMHFLHVAVIIESGEIYRLQPYDTKKWLYLNLNTEPIFIGIQNFRGKSIQTLPDQLPPTSLVFQNPETGELQMTGHVAKLMREFSNFYNFSLQWQHRVKPGQQMSFILLRNMTLNGSLSLPISLCGYETPSKLGVFSYPIDMGKWFLVVPCAREVSTAKVYSMVFRPSLFGVISVCYLLFSGLDNGFGCLLLQRKLDWTKLCFNERMLSGLMGQSFKLNALHMLSPRVTQSMLCLLGLVLSTLYVAQLNTLLTKRPTEQELSNFGLLSDSDVNIYFDEAERFYLDMFDVSSPVNAIRSKIIYLPTKEYQQKKGNQSNAISISSVEWPIMSKRQELFAKPAVCTYSGLVIGNFLLMSVPMQANSIFERPLNQFIHRVHTAGLVDYWKQQTLREMITLGMISQAETNEHEAFREFKVADLYWAWLCLSLGWTLGLIAFLAEAWIYWWQQKQII